MFSHVNIGSNDLVRARVFYDAVLGTLGHERDSSFDLEDQASVWGKPYDIMFWVSKPFDGQSATVGNGNMPGFLAESRAAVDAFYAAAMDNGGTDEGKPGLRPHYHENYYGAYVRDCDGNKICVACHRPE